MTKWLRALTALPEDPDSIPNTHIVAQNCLTTVPGDLMSFSRLHGYQTHMCCTDIHKGKMHIKCNLKRPKEQKQLIKVMSPKKQGCSTANLYIPALQRQRQPGLWV